MYMKHFSFLDQSENVLTLDRAVSVEPPKYTDHVTGMEFFF